MAQGKPGDMRPNFMPYKNQVDKNAHNRKRYKRLRDDYFIDKTCVKCGSSDRLEVDHIEPENKTTHRIWTWSKARREAELTKCQPLCYGCHQEKTIIFLREINTGITNEKARTVTDDKLINVVRLRQKGIAYKEACYLSGISYGSFKRYRRERKGIFSK